MLFFENFNFFYFYLNSEGSLIFFHWQTLITNRKYQRAQQITKICIKFWNFAQGYLPKNDTFCHISLDFTLFHPFLAVSVPNIVNVGHFTLIKVRRNSGELKNMPFLVGQSYHLRIAKTQGSSGWNYSAPPMTHREAQNVPKTFNRDKIHQHKAFWSTLEPFIHPWESQNDHFLIQHHTGWPVGFGRLWDYYFLNIKFSILYRLILSTSIFCPQIDLEPDCQPNQTFT